MRFKHSALKVFVACTLAAIVMLVPAQAQGSKTSNVATVGMTFSIAEQLTVAISGGPIVFPSSTTNSIANLVTVTTTGTLQTGHAAIDTIAYFASTNALTAGSQNIPAGSINMSVNGGSTVSCGQAYLGYPFSCGAVFHQVNPGVNVSDSSTVGLVLVGIGGLNLNPGSFAGTLNVVSIAN